MENEFLEIKNIQLQNTVLYNVEPIKLGSYNGESFTCYLARLSELHHLKFSEFFNKIVVPFLDKAYIKLSTERGGNRFYDGAKALNGVSNSIVDFVRTIEMLSGRTDLESLTLKKWKNIIPSRELLKENLSWCPECLKEFKEEYGFMFLPLLWFIKPVTCCFVHEINLSNDCPTCKKTIPILHRNFRNGYCPYCSTLLANSDKIMLNESTYRKELYIAENIGEMISINNLNIIERDIIKIRLNQIIKESFNGNRNKLGSQLGLPKVTFYNWTRGDSIPTIESLLELCFKLGLSLKEFLFQPDKFSGLKVINPEVHNPQTKRRKLDFNCIEQEMKALLCVSPPVSMVEAAMKLGVNKRLLYKHFSELSKKISKRYQEFIHLKSGLRKQEVTLLIDDGINQLESKGLFPTQKNIERILDINCLLREGFAKEYLNKLIEKSE